MAEGERAGLRELVARGRAHYAAGEHELVRVGRQPLAEQLAGARVEREDPLDVRLLRTGAHDSAARSAAEQHVERVGDVFGSAFVDRRQHPAGFGEGQQRYPRTFRDKLLCRSDLFWLVARDQAHQQIGINGAHGACECTGGCRPSSRRAYARSAASRRRARGGRLPTSADPPSARSPAHLIQPIQARSPDRCRACDALRRVPKSVPAQ